jgi:glycosyltransferase involved in cell wall biosynthesis
MVQTTVAELAWASWLQVVVVDDASTDDTAHVAKQTLDNLPEVSYVIVELAKNLGQSSTTAIGMSHSLGDVVVTVDDDLSYPPKEVSKLIEALSEDLDFVVGAPSTYPNSRSRRIASRVIRWLGVRVLETPGDFKFSSFCAYHRGFLSRIDLTTCRVDEVGWMYHFTQRYANTPIETAVGLRGQSNYGIRSLLKIGAPLAHSMAQLLNRLVRRASLLLALAAAILAATYLLSATLGEGLLAGFPTLAVLLLMNLSLAGIALSILISILTQLRRQRRASVFHTQCRVVKDCKDHTIQLDS